MSDPNSSVVEVVGQFLLDMVDSKQKSNKLPRLADDSDVEVISEVNKNERLSPLRESSVSQRS